MGTYHLVIVSYLILLCHHNYGASLEFLNQCNESINMKVRSNYGGISYGGHEQALRS
jgi:hypothetical protein